MKLATAAQMRAIDKRATEEFGIPGIVLMENAAIGISGEIAQRCVKPHARFAAVCGPGNNGGDGIAVARHLTARYGMVGAIWLCGESVSKTVADRDLNLAVARKMGISVRKFERGDFLSDLNDCDIVIDALLGTGARGEPRPIMAEAIRCMNSYKGAREGRLTIAVDAPSGVDSDTGTAAKDACFADVTVTLGVSKIGLHLSPAYELVGELVVGDLCLPPALLQDNPELAAVATDADYVGRALPSRDRHRDTNKSTYGAVALFAGSQGFAGAATLCCSGALRTGAGLVTLGIPEGLMDVAMARLPDEVMARGFLDTGGRQFRHAAAAQALEFVTKMDAVGLGPGIGHSEPETRAFVRDLVSHCPKPMVVDADALNCLSLEPGRGAGLVRSRKAPTVLTPHPGEMGRLLGIAGADVQADRLGSVRRAAEQFGCVVLLKGDRTLVASPDGRLAVNETGNPGMASGGMGDTLTGIAVVLLAQCADPFAAAASAAYVHGMAGDLAARTVGLAGLTASDLADHVPAALRRCQAKGSQDGEV